MKKYINIFEKVFTKSVYQNVTLGDLVSAGAVCSDRTRGFGGCCVGARGFVGCGFVGCCVRARGFVGCCVRALGFGGCGFVGCCV